LASPSFDWQAATYQAINYCAYKNRDENGNGTIDATEIKWYLPSQAQLMAMWVSYESYKGASASNFKTDAYWSATNNILYPHSSQYMDFKYGNVGHNYRSTKYWTRCVRNDDDSSAPSSMVSPGNSGEAIIDFSVAMPSSTYTDVPKGDGNENSIANQKLFKKIRIAAVENTQLNWADAKAYCPSGWRLPTQRELQAIWILKTEIQSVSGFAPFADNYYWTATESSAYPNDAWMVWMGSGSAGDAGNTPHIIKTYNGTDKDKVSVRCVREE
jgi:hypothetical protein